MNEIKLLKLVWIRVNQLRYTIFLNLRPIIKEVRLKKTVGYVKTVPRHSIGILNYLRDHTLTNFRQLIDIVIYDVPGKTFRFSCLYLLLNFLQNARFILHIKTNEVYPVPSIISLYKSANWLERESWDLFGIFFAGHNDLRRILTDYGFSGHPLRKDFPLTGFFEIRYNDSCGYIISQPVLLAQEFRVFTLENPWIRNNKITKKRSYNLINT